MNDDNKFIGLSEYLEFNKEQCCFDLTWVASELIYHKKQAICSYSGASEWCHRFFCQLLDLYSGNGPYNFSLMSYEHEARIKYLCGNGYSNEVVKWVDEHKTDRWFQCAVNTFTEIIDRLPE